MTRVPARPPRILRQRQPRDEREPGLGAVVSWEYGRLFAQLFDGDGEQSGYSSSFARTTPATDIRMISALTEQLMPRILGASQWPLQAVLYMPRLGRINASVRREQGIWNVELEAEQEHTGRWLTGIRQRCQDNLADTLKQPVHLHLIDTART